MVRFSRYAPPVEFKPGSARAAKLTQSPQRGQALFLIQDKPATIFTIAKTGAMLLIGQIRSRETAALTVIWGLRPAKPDENRSELSHTPRWLGAARLTRQWRSRDRLTV